MTEQPDPVRGLEAVEHFCVEMVRARRAEAEALLQARGPSLREALWAFLRARFVEGRADAGLARNDSDLAFWKVAGRLLAAGPDEERQRLLDEVVFRVFHPVALRPLAPFLRSAFQPEALEAALLARVRGNNPDEARLAHEIAYFVYGEAEDYPLSEAGQAVFDVG